MNNLKRTLSLALAGVMTLGVMTVSASAAEFTDAADIENATAVNTMAALGVITGREDGSFDPNGIVNRAEIAAMIARALNGGEDPNLGLASMNYFTDVKADQWFAEAVNYCYSLGIIAGRGDGTFDPTGKVTGWEAAKMMLVAMGYDANIFGFTGSTWNTNVDYYASNLTTGADKDHSTTVSLYSDVAGQRALPLTRQDAAQLIYNGMNANTITKTISGIQNGAPAYSYNMYSGSLLEKNFGAETINGLLTKSTYDAKAGKWTYTINGKTTVVSDEDCSDLFMHNLMVVYKTDKKTKVNNALAISTLNSSVVATGVMGDASVKSGKIDGYEYAEKGFNVYALNSDTVISSNKITSNNSNAWYSYDLIDNTGDGLVDAVVYYPNTIVEVTAIKDGVVTANKTNYTIDNSDPSKINTTTEDEIAKGDYVIISNTKEDKDGKVIAWNMEKLELTEATQCTGTNASGYYLINGKGYSQGKNGTKWNIGDICNFGIVNTYVVVAKPVESVKAELTMNDVVYVSEIAKEHTNVGLSGLAGKSEFVHDARVFFADGTSQIVKVNNVNGKELEKEYSDKNTYDVTADTLYTYTVKDGKYALTSLDKSEKLGFNAVSTAYTDIAEKGLINKGRVTFADNGIFFVTYLKGKDTVTEMFTGKEIKAWGETKIGSSILYGNYNKSNIMELSYGKFSVVDNDNNIAALTNAVDKNTAYGYVTSKTSATWDASANDGKGAVVYSFSVWTGTETVTYTVDKANPVPVGSVISFTATNGVIKSDDIVVIDDTNVFAITAIAGENIWVNGNDEPYTLTDDTKVIYVKGTKDGGATGVETGSIVVADLKDGKYTANVRLTADKNGKITLIVVDTTNVIRTLKDEKYTDTKTFTE